MEKIEQREKVEKGGGGEGREREKERERTGKVFGIKGDKRRGRKS